MTTIHNPRRHCLELHNSDAINSNYTEEHRSTKQEGNNALSRKNSRHGLSTYGSETTNNLLPQIDKTEKIQNHQEIRVKSHNVLQRRPAHNYAFSEKCIERQEDEVVMGVKGNRTSKLDSRTTIMSKGN